MTFSLLRLPRWIAARAKCSRGTWMYPCSANIGASSALPPHRADQHDLRALHEALRIILEEGLEKRIARHTLNYRAMRAGLEAMGMKYIPQHSLTPLNAVHTPPGIDEAKVRRRLLTEFGIEIGSGLGPFKGKAWRIGLMGHASSERNVTLLLSTLDVILASELPSFKQGLALAAMSEVYKSASARHIKRFCNQSAIGDDHLCRHPNHPSAPRGRGSFSVLTSQDELRTYECDGLTNFRVVPAAVALPSNASEIQQLVLLCHTHKIPFVARGSGQLKRRSFAERRRDRHQPRPAKSNH